MFEHKTSNWRIESWDDEREVVLVDVEDGAEYDGTEAWAINRLPNSDGHLWLCGLVNAGFLPAREGFHWARDRHSNRHAIFEEFIDFSHYAIPENVQQWLWEKSREAFTKGLLAEDQVMHLYDFGWIERAPTFIPEFRPLTEIK